MNNLNKGIRKIRTNELMRLNDIEKKYAPESLFIKGNEKIIQSGSRVSIIGTRNPSKKAIENTKEITTKLVKKNVVIVSGLAKGIDTEAHKTAIKSSGKTIAVLGTPLNEYYPRQNKKLQEKLMKDHLVISQFKIGTPIKRGNFPQRNRTMALLSNASLIIEASEKSGTRHQGWEALRLGRPLYIHQDLIKKDLKWVQKMRKYGAEIINNKDIYRILLNIPIIKKED